MPHVRCPAARRSGPGTFLRTLPASLRAVLLGCIVLSSLVQEVPAHAQDRAPTASIAHRFEIPAGSLAEVLSLYAGTAGVTLSFDAAQTHGLKSPGLHGSYTVDQGFAQLLASSGLRAERDVHGIYMLQVAPASPAIALPAPFHTTRREHAQHASTTTTLPDVNVNVTATNTGFVAQLSTNATKPDTPIIETPQAISVITRDQLDAHEPMYISQAARYEPSAQTDYAGADPRSGGSFGLRGFDADTYLDGLRIPSGEFIGPNYGPYMLESIEILRGPSAALYGQSQPGGIIDLVSKQPTADPLHEVMLQVGSYDHFGTGFDFGGPLDDDKHWLYRLTGIGYDSGTQVNRVKLKQGTIAPALTWRPDDATTLTILTGFRRDPNDGFWNKRPALGTLLHNPEGQIPDDLFTGDLGFNVYRVTQASIGYAFEHKFNDIWTIRQNFRYQYAGGTFNSVQDDELVGTQLIRDKFQSINGTHNVALDTQAQADVDTGALQHKILLGIDGQRALFAEKDSDTGDGGGNEDVPPLDIYAPDYHQAIPTYSPGDTYIQIHQTTDQLGAYAQDQMALGHWRAAFSLREDWAKSSTTNLLAGNAVQEQTDTAITWRAGLLYLFDSGVAPYVSYATSFTPTIGTNTYGQAFKPTTGQQYEVGLKYQPPSTNLLLTASLFNLAEQNVLTSDPSNPNNSIQTGEQRSRGLELQAKAGLTSNFDLTASYAYLDAKVTQANDGTQGFHIWDVPRNAGSVWADYKLTGTALAGLSLGGGVRYTGSTTDQSNTLHVPPFTLIDAAVRYDFGPRHPDWRGLSLAINITNLFDKQYIQQCVNGCYYGYRRSVIATAKYDW